ncbi:MAG TPA: TrkA family potassium uptake protein [Candidatus Limnocylindrales bacterium]|jgi:trk system potassium uptake protein|nr:TrkA family potassium uptake protein [Candidatus Limnocylindrales bacterium]
MKQQVIVVGLGRFGAAAARELNALGHEVLAVDAQESVVNEIAAEVTHAVQADASDEQALRAIGADQFDTAIVAISSALEASIFATMALKRLGVPKVIAKATTTLHGEILERVGADRVVYPEREAGVDVAHTLTVPHVLDYIDFGPGHGIAKIRVPRDFVGRTLREIDLPGRLKVTPLALRHGSEVTINPHRDQRLEEGDQLVLVGLDEQLAKVSSDNA